MFGTTKSKRIVNTVLLSLLCFESVFSEATETAIRSNDNEDKGEDKDVLRLHLDRFTRRKRSATFSWIIPTATPLDNRKSNSPVDPILYGFIPLVLIFFVYLIFCSCIEIFRQGSSSAESLPHRPIPGRNNVNNSQQQVIPAEIFITVNQLPPRTTNLLAQMHTPLTRRHQVLDSRTVDLPMTDLWFNPGRNVTTSDNTGVNGSSMYPNCDNSSQGITETYNTPPPDYSTCNQPASSGNTGVTDSFRHHNCASSQSITGYSNTVDEKPPDYFAVTGKAASDNTGVHGSFTHHNFASSHDITGYSNTVEDMPPDYSTLTS